MAFQFSINLVDGQEISIPFDVDGSATADGARKFVAVSRQIDGGTPQDMGLNCTPWVPNVSDPAQNPTTFEFDFVLGSNDCPQNDTYYMLTMLIWDDGAAPSLNQRNVSFKVVAPNMGGGIPGM